MDKTDAARRLTVGAELRPGGGADVRVWAPACQRLELVVTPDINHGSETAGGRPRVIAMSRDADGYFQAFDGSARAGERYWFRLEGDRLRPDPASRHQPEGPHAPSAYVDPRTFKWTDQRRKGLQPIGQIVYEMHIGTFTREGTWRAAAAGLDELARIGITVIEMMPIAEFPGRFGWGYDGVNLYAPAHVYGTPDDLRMFIDRAHALGLGVILDVVYNHLGPDGNYLNDFSTDYFTDKYTNDWGRAINFEGPGPVRELFVQSAGYWIDEFHFDGLRLDATQDIRDASPRHVMIEMIAAARKAAPGHSIFIVAENEPQETIIVRPPAEGGYGADALWNDDAHHAAVVALVGRREAYYRDYLGSAQELVSSARFGYLYQGQWYTWQEERRGTPALDLLPRAFVTYLENHDQVANSASGRRLHQLASPAGYRAMTAWLLLGPATPMLFQGQEYASSKPFLYFADHKPELAEAVGKGRVEFLGQFPSLTDDRVVRGLAAPADEDTFTRCKLDPSERDRHREAYALHCDLLALRTHDAVLSRAGTYRPEGAVLGPETFLLRYLDGRHGDRLLVVNLGSDLDFMPVREPLLAPPYNARWRMVWSSEAPQYGGQGAPPPDLDRPWIIPGGCALLFVPEPR
jgi:maltooligosyltrehalose trehalohydrolase